MRQAFISLLTFFLALPCSAGGSFNPQLLARAMQDEQNERRVLTIPNNGQRRRRTGYDRKKGRGIKSAFGKAGRGAGRGGKRFGQNMAKGRPVRAGKELGKGMGRFGKYTDKGVARTAKRVFKP